MMMVVSRQHAPPPRRRRRRRCGGGALLLLLTASFSSTTNAFVVQQQPRTTTTMMRMSTTNERPKTANETITTAATATNHHHENEPSLVLPIEDDEDIDDDTVTFFRNVYEFNNELNRLANLVGTTTTGTGAVAQAAACEDFWRQHCQDDDHRRRPWTPDVATLNTVLKAWARCSQSLAEQQQQHHDDVLASSTAASTTTDGSSLHSVNVYTAANAAQHAQDLLFQFLGHHDDVFSSSHSIHPDITSFNVVIDAWAKSKTRTAPDHCQSLLQHVQNNKAMTPNIFTYNSLLEAYLGSSTSGTSCLTSIGRIVEHASKNLTPNSRTWNLWLQALNKFGEPQVAATKGLQLLNRLKQEQWQETTGDDDKDGDAAASSKEQVVLAFNAQTYLTVIHSLAKCKSPQATQRAHALHDDLYVMHQTLVERGDANALASMLAPTVYTYTALISAIAAGSGSFVRRQQQEEEDYSFPPVISGTTNNLLPPELQAIHDLDRPEERADALLDLALSSSSSSGAVQPNVRLFTVVIQTWARRARGVKKAARAFQLLQQMNEFGIEPNQITYKTALEACRNIGKTATAQQQTASLKLAFAIFKKSIPQANSYVYAALFHCIAQLMPGISMQHERNDMGTALWNKVVEAGHVTPAVCSALQQAVDTDCAYTLLEPLRDIQGRVQFDKIPLSWSRHEPSSNSIRRRGD